MKANLKETMTTSSAAAALGLHRKSNAAMHRGSSSNGGGVSRARLSELAAAVAGNPNQTSEEMQLYFSKLKELVPFMPRNRKLSKLEIIQYVIDYICDLQLALETQPKAAAAAASNAAMVSAVSLASAAASATPTSTHQQQLRQPLGVIPSNNTVCSVQEASFSLSGHSLPHHGHSLPLHDSKGAGVCEQSC